MAKKKNSSGGEQAEEQPKKVLEVVGADNADEILVALTEQYPSKPDTYTVQKVEGNVVLLHGEVYGYVKVTL